MKIFAYIPCRALGDFVSYAALISSIKELFDDSQLFVYYRNDRPYKEPIVRCMWNASGVVTLPPESQGIPLDYFDVHAGRPSQNVKFWEDHKLHLTELVLTGAMLNELMLNTIPTTTLCPPAQTAPEHDQALINLGLDPTKWIAAFYWKEGGYEFRGPNAVRTIFDPEPYFAAIRHVVALGGQVVRLGHPTPTTLPQLKGVVDLAKVPNSEFLQIFAVARSRFFVGSSSGPASYGSAFGVPTANTDQTLCLGAWGEKDYIVTQSIEVNGKIHRQQEAFDAGLLVTTFNQTTAKYHRNTASELLAATDEMFNVTKDCPGWRPLVPRQITGSRANAISLPIVRKLRPDLLVPPSQRAL